MSFTSRTATAAFLTAVLAASAEAGQVRLQIRDGLVTLQAVDASPREILAEWARVGQTRVVNGDKVAGGVLTLELNGVPERQALDIVLRAAPGYLAAPRQVAAAGASIYDRILVMPGLRQAAGIPAPAPVAGRGRGNQPAGNMGSPAMGNQPQPTIMVDDQDEPVVQQPMPNPVSPGAAQPGMPTQSPYPNQPVNPYGNPYANPYGIQQQQQQQQQQQPVPATAPGMTGPGTASRPGMPTAPPKPPGGPGGE